MDFILGKLITYHVYYEKVTENTLRVYGGPDGYSIVRYYCGQIEIDGRVVRPDEFETWIICTLL